MNITPANNNLDLLAVKAKKIEKEIESKELDKSIKETEVIKTAEDKLKAAEGIEKDVMLANIDAASINPELINNLKLFKFHSNKDYEKTSKAVGKNIDVYSTGKS